MSLLELRILEIHSFPHFSPTSFDTLSWNFANDVVLLYYRSSLSVVNFRQILLELCPFWNLQYWINTVFRTFFLHALAYWAEILHMTLVYCTTDQVWVLSIFVGVMSLLELGILEIHSFPLFFLHALTYWSKILHMTLFHCTTDQVWVSSIFAGGMPIFIRPSSDGTYYGMVMSVRVSVRPSVRHSFPHFSPTWFDILIRNFVCHFIFMHVRSSSNAINFRHFLQELCSFLTSNSYKYALFRTFLLHALTYWVQILYMTLF